MRMLVILIAVLGSGCSSLMGSSASDACKLVEGAAVAEVMGSQMTRMELDKGIKNGKLVSSACYMDFKGGEFVRLSIEHYSDLDYMHRMRDSFDKYNPRSEDAQISATLGRPAYYDSSRERLEVDLDEGKFLYINMDNRSGRKASSASMNQSGPAPSSGSPKIVGAREKVTRLAQLVKI